MIATRSFIAGAIVMGVLGGGSAVAATGGKFILGYSNSATKTSTLSNAYGTPLALTAKSGSAPLKVNSGTKVTYLNADRVDGLDSSAFARTSGGTYPSFSFDDLQSDDWFGGPDNTGDGVDDVMIAVAYCDDGTIATGGSGWSYDGSPIIDSFGFGPIWVAVTSNMSANPDDFGANVTCYDPTGSAMMFREASPRQREVGKRLLAR